MHGLGWRLCHKRFTVTMLALPSCGRGGSGWSAVAGAGPRKPVTDLHAPKEDAWSYVHGLGLSCTCCTITMPGASSKPLSFRAVHQGATSCTEDAAKLRLCRLGVSGWPGRAQASLSTDLGMHPRGPGGLMHVGRACALPSPGWPQPVSPFHFCLRR
jgi:hypothetical protein